MHVRPTRLTIGAGTLAASALFGLFGAIPTAFANQDPAADPPNCTTADLEGVRAGVSAATSAYLFTHPDVNNFFTSLEGLTREQTVAKVKAYMSQNPQTHDDLVGIRQPLQDLKSRCGQVRARWPRPYWPGCSC